MPSKLDIQNLIWGWIDKIEPENVTTEHVKIAYRLRLPKCQPGVCRRNCQGNPNCFECLFKKEKESADDTISDAEEKFRKKGELAGLSNLGATCYVNCFLQLWYHNISLRRAVYDYQLTIEPKLSDSSDLESYADKDDQVGQLQCLFGLLQFSQRSNIDPTFFINSLKLNANEQQDAQEFSKLFLSLIEHRLADQPNSNVRNIIKTLFQGSLDYNTRCSFCNNVSVSSSTFYELDLNISENQTLDDCISDYIRDEKLIGDEKYYCSYCNKKQDAVRFIKLKKLPPYLNFQLLRFVYNRRALKKTKLKNCIEFPEVLDMSSYLGESEPVLYDLNAVLIHRGTSAYEGHYVAALKDHQSNNWHQFSDDLVEKLKSCSLNFDADEEQPSKTKNLAKGMSSSRNTYMLVYQSRTYSQKLKLEESNWKLPERLERVIENDNIKCEDLLNSMREIKEKQNLQSKLDEEELLETWKNLPAGENSDWEFLSTVWINKWLSRKTPLSNIDNACDRCKHNRMPPECVKNFKVVNSAAVSTLYAKYGGGPRMSEDFLCLDCVAHECLARRVELSLQEDAKLITLKTNNNEKQFWVGKRSFQIWRRIALNAKLGNDKDSKDQEIKEFNSDLLCSHGNLSANKNGRKLVSKVTWDVFKKYFPSAAEFSSDEVECLQCQNLAENESAIKFALREMAMNQKSQLADLYLGKNRPEISKLDSKCYAVNLNFITSWRNYLRHPGRLSPVTNLNNNSMMCTHSLLLVPVVDVDGFFHPQPEQRPVLLWEKEWKDFQTFVTVDQEVIVTAENGTETDGAEKLTVKHQPDICQECCVSYCISITESQIGEKLQYSNRPIYIRLVSNNKNDNSEDEICEEDEKAGAKKDGPTGRNKRTKNFKPMNGQNKNSSDAKRRKCEEPDFVDDSIRPCATMIVRRSARRQKSRSEIEVKMSSSQTLQDLKVEIMNHIGVSPVSQHLTVSGSDSELNSIKSTLEELRIFPESTIYVKVDEDWESFQDEKAFTYEEGFKGTQLLGN